MLESLRSLLTGQGPGADVAALSRWAKQAGHAFKRMREPEGFAIDGRDEGLAWRLEWGSPQRSYIEGRELRIRMELGLPPDLQLLLLTAPLLERLERDTFEAFTRDNQTQMGDAIAEELRWLVMFPKIEMPDPKALSAHFGGVSSVRGRGSAWIDGALGEALMRATERLLLKGPPFVLMTLRGRLYLRLQLPSPDAGHIAEALELFETASASALRIADARRGQRDG